MKTMILKDLPINGEEGMNKLGSALGACLAAGDCVFLSGEMGMGKSVLARAVARVFGVTGPMPSPSFTILQAYDSARVPVKHFDLYRLEEYDEFYSAGLDEEMDSASVSLVEWPEMTDFVPEKVLYIRITRGENDEQRLITMENKGLSGERADRIRSACLAAFGREQ